MRELERVAGVAEEDSRGVSWIGSRKRGVAFAAHADSRLLAFARLSGTDVLELTARIVARHHRLPRVRSRLWIAQVTELSGVSWLRRRCRGTWAGRR